MSDVLLNGYKDKIRLPSKVAALLRNADISLCMNGMSPASVFQVNTQDKTFFLKCSPVSFNDTSFDVWREKEKYDFLSGKVIVPDIVAHEETEDHRFLLMTAVEGEELLDVALSNDEGKYVHHLNTGLSALRSIRGCPFFHSLSAYFAEIDSLVAKGFAKLRDRSAYETLKASPVSETLVVTHGDIRNIICRKDGVAFIDVGKLGLADEHVDFATGVLEIEKHFGEDARSRYLANTPFKFDEKKLDYFLRLHSVLSG